MMSDVTVQLESVQLDIVCSDDIQVLLMAEHCVCVCVCV